MSRFGKPDATGRSSGKRSGSDRKLRSPPKGEAWAWMTRDMLTSPAIGPKAIPNWSGSSKLRRFTGLSSFLATAMCKTAGELVYAGSLNGEGELTVNY